MGGISAVGWGAGGGVGGCLSREGMGGRGEMGVCVAFQNCFTIHFVP